MVSKKIYILLIAALVVIIGVTTSSCGAYSFTGASVPDSIKTIYVKYIDNKARYVNTQLSPRLTDRLKQKINNQTKLTQTNSEVNTHYIIDAHVSDYSVSTSGISNQQAAMNRLTVSVRMSVINNLANKTDQYDVTRSYEFKGNTSLQSAEAGLIDNMIRDLSDDIFNRVFSNW
jgi:hypothetical protein